jgi:hypothetical protein
MLVVTKKSVETIRLPIRRARNKATPILPWYRLEGSVWTVHIHLDDRKLQLPKPYNALQEYLDHDDDEMKVTFSTSAGTPGIKNKSTAHVANWSFVKTEGNSVVVNSTFSFRNWIPFCLFWFMGNKTYSTMSFTNYRLLDTIEDQQLGEIKVYKSLCFSEFIAYKSFIFV